MTIGHRIWYGMLTLAAAFPAMLSAQDLPVPTGEILLTVTGEIARTNDGESAVFDLAMLEDLDPVTFRTGTIWTDGEQEFTGVPLHRLMEAVGAEGSALSAQAVNDYAVEIPAEDWAEGGAIVAYLQNGETMSLRGKGPLWVVYPFDSAPQFQTETVYSRSIWQLDRITVDP